MSDSPKDDLFNELRIRVGVADELEFVDPDIAKTFSQANYVQGIPTQIQLARYLKLIYKEIYKRNQNDNISKA